MKNFITEITNKVLNDKNLTYEEGLKILEIDEENVEVLFLLFEGANKIRAKFAGNKVDLCTIMNAKSGKCSEDCRYCAQSAHYHTGIPEYPLLQYNEILKRALELQNKGVHRFSLVTSGRGIDGDDFENIVNIYKRLKKDTNLKLCASHGIINVEQMKKLKEAGVSMYHHNIETSRNHYKNICTTHTYEDRINTIKAAINAGLDVCCGGIIGMGETIKDQVMTALEIRDLNIKSIPINILNPIKGTPFEDLKPLSPYQILKVMALYRFLIPDAYIRYAGGRMNLGTKQRMGFKAGVNAALVGNYLTTIGSNIDQDKEMILNEGLQI